MLLMVISACVTLVLAQAVRACTIFNQSAGGTVLVGNNEDWYYSAPATVVFTAASRTEHGRVCFALYGYAQGGMNDAGLCIDSAVCPAVAAKSGEPAALGFTFWERLLAQCANVEEALRLLQKYGAPITRADHFMLVDKTGASAVVEWMDGAAKIIRKQGSYQVITNFWLAKPDMGWYPCPRFEIAEKMLQEGDGLSVSGFARILKAASQDNGSLGTIYSNIYDLTHGMVRIYYKRDFTKAIEFNLEKELAKGNQSYNLADLYAKKD